VNNVGKIRIVINEDKEVGEAVDRKGAHWTIKIAMNELAWFQSTKGGSTVGVAVRFTPDASLARRMAVWSLQDRSTTSGIGRNLAKGSITAMSMLPMPEIIFSNCRLERKGSFNPDVEIINVLGKRVLGFKKFTSRKGVTRLHLGVNTKFRTED
jgi:hypothetical protein